MKTPPAGSDQKVPPPPPGEDKDTVDNDKDTQPSSGGFQLGGSNIGRSSEGGSHPSNKSLADRFGKGNGIKVSNSNNASIKPRADGETGETDSEGDG